MLVSATSFAEPKDTVDKKVQFEAKEDGGYESSAVTETVSETGTKEKIKTVEKVDISPDGHVVGTVKTDTITNPKGLMNETYKQEEAKNKINPDGSAELDAHSKSVDKTGTAVDSTLKTVSKINEDGTTRTTSNLKTTIDPKGMLNKQVIETNKVTDSAKDGAATTFVEKKVDGKVVEKSVQ